MTDRSLLRRRTPDEALRAIAFEHYESRVAAGRCSECATRWPCWTLRMANTALDTMRDDGRAAGGSSFRGLLPAGATAPLAEDEQR